MTRFILSRSGQAVLTVIAASVVVFLLSRATGNPAQLMLPDTATPEEIAALTSRLGFDRPIWEQYSTFVSNLLQGDFGQSAYYKRPVIELIGERAPATIRLGLIGFTMTVLIALPAGIYAARRPGSLLDRTVQFFAGLGQSLPDFWVATMLIAVFSVMLRLTPTYGAETPAHYILPVVVMSFFGFAGLARLTRSSMIEALSTEYIKFAKAKGVRERKILWKHAFRNAAISVVTFAGLMLVGTLTGSVIVETVFAWPGIGQFVVQSVLQRDFPVVQIIVLFLSIAFVLGNFLVDIAYAFLDPKVRYTS